ncbi:hypothetical protein [Seleniivibrio sp.]|uniref:hypothetical protein n=1 Tax=Seleniivibrio sp. TaxID=2898801 RepID=UPI0025F5B5A6|nr:hypothetical protein [Seleniivibrio sp.]MCD8554263.1 hypothetical protein [Seleniivibrio sp.]
MKSKQWILTFFVSVLLIGISTAVFVWYSDPHDLGKIENRDYNSFSDYNMRYIKFKQIQKLKPSYLILGSSRAYAGYDTINAYFDNNTYNAGVGGASMYEVNKYFDSALKQGNLKKVLIGLDYLSFNAQLHVREKNFDDYEQQQIWFYTYTIRFDAVKDSIKKALGTLKRTHRTFTARGVAESTEKNMFLDNISVAMSLLKYTQLYADMSSDYRYGDTKRNSFDDFSTILDECYKNNIEVELVFNPSHVLQWEVATLNVGYDSWLKWKKDVVDAVYKSAEEHGKKPFPIIDFAVYNDITTEKIPHSSNEMQYYYDTSHFKRNVGDMVLERLKSGVVKDGFGIELNPRMMDGYLAKMKQERADYLKKYLKENGSLFSKTSADFDLD